MKSCPSCQQVYTDDGPDYCLNDGTPLVKTVSQYNPGAAYSNQWQPQAPPGWGNQPSQYPPYGYGATPPVSGGGGIAKAALFTGIGSAAALAIIILIMATSHASYELRAFVGILGILSLIAGLVAIILGIVSLSMASKNPAISKAKGVIGLCLGAIPLILMLIGIIAASSRRF
jgi:hypothetical protein